ncbi:MAG: LysM peptidoglycan-binding domain-containing protein [Bacteroidota bacterium]
MRRVVLPVLFVLIASSAMAQPSPERDNRSVQAAVDDLRLATAVQIALMTDPRTRPFDVQVGAREGIVAVFGIEDSTYQQIATGIAAAVPGVRGLQGLGGFSPADAPEAVPVDIPALPQTHVVRRGDTLFAIARRYGVSVGTLRDLNRLRGDRIRVGQRLRLR